MHQRTIDHVTTSITITEHPTYGAAHRAPMDHVVGADFYRRPLQNCAATTSYELLRLADDAAAARAPLVTSAAAIKEFHEKPVSAPDFVAYETQRWIEDHAVKWAHGSTTDPGDRYPMAVLTTAHGEAHLLLRAGTLLPEAARLAGVESAGHLDQDTLEVLRRSAIALAGAGRHHTCAALATEVQRHLPADVDAHQTAALIWWTALLSWGATTP